MKRRSYSWALGAFTLLELLVALVVLMLLVTMLATMVDSGTKLWRENENRADAYREARSALNIISADLSTMVVSTNTNYFSTNVIGSVPPGMLGNGIYFLTSMSSDAQPSGSKSDLCTVGYFVRWAKQNSGFGQTNAQDPTKEGFQLYRTLYGSDITYSNLITATAPLTNLAAPSLVQPEILARNICSLEFRFFQQNPDTNNTVKFLAWTNGLTTTNATNLAMPQMIEVRITAISDELAKKLAGNSNRWTTNDVLVKQSMRSFVSRVRIPSLSTN
jgi:type II secretory pathway pseudopilin PulG